jgi:glycosyltransferase involved in cell wall biosynthesis
MKVSVVTPSFNQGKFIERTIVSVLSQDCAELEYVVVDGGSSDGTLSILGKYADRIRWLSEPDEGQSDAVNKGIRSTSGEIIGWLNSDDIYYPGALATVVEFFTENPDVDVLYGNADVIDVDDNVLAAFRAKPWDFSLLAADDYMCQPATFLRRSVVERHGLLDTKLHYCMDYEYWLRLGKAGVRFAFVERTFAAARMYPENKTLRGGSIRAAEIVNMLKGKVGFVPDSWLLEYATASVSRRVLFLPSNQCCR